MLLCESIVDFKHLKDNGFDFSEILEFQGWKGFFERLTSPEYPVLVKQFWIHVVATKDTISSLFMNKKIVVTLKSMLILFLTTTMGKGFITSNLM